MASLGSASSSFFKRRFMLLAVPAVQVLPVMDCVTEDVQSHTLFLLLLPVFLLYCSELPIKRSGRKSFTCAYASCCPHLQLRVKVLSCSKVKRGKGRKRPRLDCIGLPHINRCSRLERSQLQEYERFLTVSSLVSDDKDLFIQEVFGSRLLLSASAETEHPIRKPYSSRSHLTSFLSLLLPYCLKKLYGKILIPQTSTEADVLLRRVCKPWHAPLPLCKDTAGRGTLSCTERENHAE